MGFFKMLLKLMLTALLNAVLAVAVYLVEKHTPFGGLKRVKKQIIIGLIFGAMAVLASTNIAGVDIGDGVITNVRDAAPICAGLIFGAPAGIIAGLIGGVYRYFAVFLGLAGSYTQIACAVSTVLAGFIAASLRKFMFDDKKPSWVYGIGTGVICEVIHMLMIFFTNMNDTVKAFSFVQDASIPMIVCNAFSAGAAMLAISLMNRERRGRGREKKQISTTFQVRLFVCILIAYFLTSAFTYVLQSRMSDTETASVIQRSITDVHKDITDASDENLLEKAESIKDEYMSNKGGGSDLLRSLSEGLVEIHVSYVVRSTNNPYNLVFPYYIQEGI